MPNATTGFNKQVYYRLIALWILCEAMLGGVVHGFKLPVSGLIVGSCSVICISLIAWYVPSRGAIIKATIIVAIFKMMLSPQSPFPAYVAVLFQGLLGELLFFNRRFYKMSCLLLGVLSLLESALQRIAIMTLIYGMGFWKALNDFINKFTHEKEITNYSLYFIVVYIAIHLLMGLFIGWLTGILPKKIDKWKTRYFNPEVSPETTNMVMPPKARKTRWFQRGVIVVWIVLILLYLQSTFKIGEPILPAHVSMQIFIRSLLFVLTWYILLNPLFSYLLKKWLEKKKEKEQGVVHEILTLVPLMKQIAMQSWWSTASYKGVKRIVVFCKTILVNTLYTG